MSEPLYIFIDESGNFDFSEKGTKYFTFSALITDNPLKFDNLINRLKLDILTKQQLPELNNQYLDRFSIKHFHATEDKQLVRNLFFELIKSMDNIKLNSIVIEKRKTNPTLYDPEKFYTKFLGSLMAYVFQAYWFDELCIFVDGCAVDKNKDAFKKGIVKELYRRNSMAKFVLYFPSSSTFSCLQVVDYLSWAIFRKWEKKDLRSYDQIKHILQSQERDIFKEGKIYYY